MTVCWRAFRQRFLIVSHAIFVEERLVYPVFIN